MAQQQLREKVSTAFAVTTHEPATHCKHPNRTMGEDRFWTHPATVSHSSTIDQKVGFTYKKENNKVCKDNLVTLTCSCSYAVISFAVTLDVKALHRPRSTEVFRCCFQALVCRGVK